MEASLEELNQKIDALTAQMACLTEQACRAERRHQATVELVDDITPLANQAFIMAIKQLEEVQEYIDLSDLLRLFKRLLRNGRNIEKMLDQLESLADLVTTLSPLAEGVFSKAIDVTAQLEHKGYFTLARTGMNMIDTAVTSLTADEMEQMAELITPAINMLKEIAQPEVINFADHTLAQVKQEVSKPVDGSFMGLVRQMRDPAVRRGIALTLRLMQAIGTQVTDPAPSGQ